MHLNIHAVQIRDNFGRQISFPQKSVHSSPSISISKPLYSEKDTPLGIKVTAIAPSSFRTDWAGRSAKEAPNTIEDYKTTAETNKNNIRNNSGKQAGDPERAAKAIVKVVENETPPMRLLLGEAAYKGANNKLFTLKAEFDAWAETSIGAISRKKQLKINDYETGKQDEEIICLLNTGCQARNCFQITGTSTKHTSLIQDLATTCLLPALLKTSVCTTCQPDYYAIVGLKYRA